MVVLYRFLCMALRDLSEYRVFMLISILIYAFNKLSTSNYLFIVNNKKRDFRLESLFFQNEKLCFADPISDIRA